MDITKLSEGKIFPSGFLSMCDFCCFPRLIRWFEGFQSLDVDSQDTTSHDCNEDEDRVEYRDITQRFIDETNSMYSLCFSAQLKLGANCLQPFLQVT